MRHPGLSGKWSPLSKRKLPYHEGDWCSIPLGAGGYALGLIARGNGKGQLFGFFFGPRRPHPPRFEETLGLKPADAVLHTLCNDLGLINRHWRFIGRAAVWDRFEWPLPLLVERDPEGVPHAVQYQDSLSSRSRVTVIVPMPELARLQGAAVVGPSAIEGFLDKTLAKLSIPRTFPIV